MRRREILSALVCGTGVLAGCSTESRFNRESTSTPASTPPPNVTTFTETKTLPTPDGVSSREAARSFVQTHEQRYVYNELVDGFGGSQPAINIDVEPTQVAVVHTTDSGYYLLSSCTGSAEYYDPDGSPSNSTRNASSVAHFVGPTHHRRIPFNAYRCQRPIVESSSEVASDEPAVRFQIYDFDTKPDYVHPEQGGHMVDVTLTDADGTSVLEREYQTSLPLTVQPRVTETPGQYTLSASLADGRNIQHTWSLSGPASPSWWALSILITNGGDLAVQMLYPNEAVGLPSGTLCRHMGDE